MALTPLYEVIDRRTENAKHWRMSNGSYQAIVSTNPVHYKDVNGTWQNLYTDIVDPVAVAVPKQPINSTQEHNGGWAHSAHFTTPYNKLDLRLPKNIKSGYTVGHGTDRLTFTPAGASPSLGQIDPNNPACIDYQDVWVDTDVCLEVHSERIKETIVLKSNNSPTTFSFKVDGALASDYTSGALKILAPWYEDTNGTKKDATIAQRTQGANTFVDITVDTTGMTFPIQVDPTVTIADNTTGGMDSFTANNNTTANYGTQTTLTVQALGSSDLFYSFVYADVSSVPVGATISSAQLQLGFDGFYNTSSYPIDSYQVLGSWTETGITWATQPSISSTLLSAVTVSSSTTYSSWDITSAVNNWINGGQTNYGICFIPDPAYNADNWGVDFKSKEFGSDVPQFVINYDQPPTAPSNVVPSGGETINSTFNITWTAATDPDTAQSALTYQIDFSGDNGSTWTTIVSATAAGATSYTYDFTNTAATSQGLIRIRAYDGTLYGPYAQSAGVFTIQHDQAPTAPTNLSPSTTSGTFDYTQPITASWTFNDPDVGDSQSAFNIKWSKDGGSTWTQPAEVVSASSSYQWAGSTFASGDTVDWMVQTYDQSGLNSPWSAQAQFSVGAVPTAPTITSPANNATVSTANPTIQWSASGQAGYEIQIRDTNGTSLYDEQHSTSTNTAQTLTGYNLANATTYEIAVRIINSQSLWSAWAVNTVNVSYTAPGSITVTPSSQIDLARMSVVITNTAPTGTEPTLDHNDLYRRETGSTAWTRIATGLGSDATYYDYAVASGVSYDYMGTAVGTNSTSTDSPTVSASVGQLRGVWIHDVSDPSGTSLNALYMNNSQSSNGSTPNNESVNLSSTTLQFAGRDLPNIFFGESYSQSLTKGRIFFATRADWETLRALLMKTPTLCLRDGRGRKMFGGVPTFKVSDMTDGVEVDLTLQVTSYSEAV